MIHELAVGQPQIARGGSSSEGLGQRALAFVESHAIWVLAMLMSIEAGVLLYMGRGLTFFFDDWDFVTHDFGGGIHSLLVAHVGNPVVFPVLVYKALFHVVGLNHYAVYRLVVIALHLLATGLIFTLASHRIANAPALLATALILFLGAAWEDILWAFQISYMLSIVGGLAAWLFMERVGRRGDIAAMGCLIVSIGSSGIGVAIMVGVAVELLWRREGRRRIWVVVVPAALYGLWYLHYGESEVTKNSLIAAPGFFTDLIAAAFGGLIGRGLEWGRPLALVGILILLRYLAGHRRVSARLAGLLATGVALWAITAAARSTTSTPETSRYIYLGAVVIVLVAVELLRGVAVSPRALAAVAVLVLVAAVTGLTVLHNGAEGLRADSRVVSAELGALEIAAGYVPPTYQPDSQRAPQITAGPYLHTVRAIGSTPADTSAQIVASGPATRTEVDAYLLKLEGGGAFGPIAAGTQLSGRLPLVANVGGTPPVRGPDCWMVRAVGPGTYTEFILPPAGLMIRAGSQAVQVVVRRFSPPLGGVELGVIAPRRTDVVKLPVDASGRPWFVRLASDAPSRVCGVD